MAQWIRRWSTEPEILGSIPSEVATFIFTKSLKAFGMSCHSLSQIGVLAFDFFFFFFLIKKKGTCIELHKLARPEEEWGGAEYSLIRADFVLPLQVTW
jgi:hypothetical protein